METDVNVAPPVVMPAACWDNTGGGLAPGAAALPTIEAEGVETAEEG